MAGAQIDQFLPLHVNAEIVALEEVCAKDWFVDVGQHESVTEILRPEGKIDVARSISLDLAACGRLEGWNCRGVSNPQPVGVYIRRRSGKNRQIGAGVDQVLPASSTVVDGKCAFLEE